MKAAVSRYAVAAALGLATFVCGGVAQAQLFDHLKCYKVKGSAAFDAQAALNALRSEFADESCTVVGKAKLYCTPVEKNVTAYESKDGLAQVPLSGQDLSDDRICYKVKCSAAGPTSLTVTDQFGTRGVGPFKPQLLCTPAQIGVPVTTTTTLPPLPPCTGGSPWPSCATGDCSTVGVTHFCDPRSDGTCACVKPCNELDPSGGDICGVGGCPVDSRCELIDPTHCGCVFSPGS
jgi:hypothetical protein